MAPRVKICCISSLEEARLAVQFGASALGLVGPMPSGPGVISDDLIFEIARQAPPPIGTFLLTSETDAQAIIQHQKRSTPTPSKSWMLWNQALMLKFDRRWQV
jgi:phosphoribosylanthranilate isomerase